MGQPKFPSTSVHSPGFATARVGIFSVLVALAFTTAGCITTPKTAENRTKAREEDCLGGNAVKCRELGERAIRDDATLLHGASLLDRACDAGDPLACFRLAELRRVGRGVAAEPARRMAELSRACTGDIAEACTQLGDSYRLGDGVERSAGRAVELYERACLAGDSASCAHLGHMVLRGIGVERDSDKAFSLLRRACDAGSAEGCTFLADEYLSGRELPRDQKRAIELYRRACNGGFAHACARLGAVVERGVQQAPNPVEARRLYQQSCDKNSSAGCVALGRLHLAGEQKDVDRARGLFAQACASPDPFGGCAELARIMVGSPASSRTEDALEVLLGGCAKADAEACLDAGEVFAARGETARAVEFVTLGCRYRAEETRCEAARSAVGLDGDTALGE